MYLQRHKSPTPILQQIPHIPKGPILNSPKSKFVQVSSEKPLLPQSRSIKKQQIIDINLSHIPPSRLYSPPHTKTNPLLKQLTDKPKHLQIHKHTNSQIITKQNTYSKQHTPYTNHTQQQQIQSSRLKLILKQKQTQIDHLQNQIKKQQIESKANIYYCELINDIGDMLGMDTVNLTELRHIIRQLIKNNTTESFNKSSLNRRPQYTEIESAKSTIRHQLEEAERSNQHISFRLEQITQKYQQLELLVKEQDIQVTKLNNQKQTLHRRLEEVNAQKNTLINEISNRRIDNNVQMLKTKLKEMEQRLGHQAQQSQIKLQQLLNLRVTREQLESQLTARNKENIKLRSDYEQLRVQNQLKIKQLMDQIQEIRDIQEVRDLEIEGATKQTRQYITELEAGRREIAIKKNQYESMRKGFLLQIQSLEKMKDDIHKQMERQHQLRLSSEEKYREKQLQLSRYETQITTLEKQNIGLTSSLRNTELVAKEIEQQKKLLQSQIERLQVEIGREKDNKQKIKKGFQIQKNQWLRDQNIKIKLEVDPIKKRTDQLQILCRKYQGVIRQLEENNQSKSTSTLKDARAVANQLQILVKSEEYSKGKISHIENLIKQIVTKQNASSQKLSLEITNSILGVKQDSEKKYNETLIAKEKEIQKLRNKTAQLQNKLTIRSTQLEMLNRRLIQDQNNYQTIKRQLQLNQGELSKYTQQVIKYKSKLEVLEKSLSITSNNNNSYQQQLISQFKNQISQLQMQLSQKQSLQISSQFSHNLSRQKKIIDALEVRLKENQYRYQQSIRSLEEVYRNQIQYIKEEYKQASKDLQVMYSKSMQDAMDKAQQLRVEVHNLNIQKQVDRQNYQFKVKDLERQLNQKNIKSAEETQRFGNLDPAKTVQDLKLRIEELERERLSSHEVVHMISEIQKNNLQLKRHYQYLNQQADAQNENKLHSLQLLSNRQLAEAIQKLDFACIKHQKVQYEIKGLRQQIQILRQKNMELSLQIVGRISDEDVSKQLLKERNQMIIKLQKDINELRREMNQSNKQNSINNQFTKENFIKSKSVQWNLEKQVIHSKNTIKLQQIKIQQLVLELQTISKLRNIAFRQLINDLRSDNVSKESLIIRMPLGRKGGLNKSIVNVDRPRSINPKISSLQRTIQATRTLMENNQRTSDEIKSQFAQINNDSYYTVKPVAYHERSGSKSPRSSQQRSGPKNIQRIQIGEVELSLMQSPTVRSNALYGGQQRSSNYLKELSSGSGEVMFRRLKSEQIGPRIPNINYSQFQEGRSDKNNSKFSVQFGDPNQELR